MLSLSCASRLKAVDADGSALTLRATHHAVFGTSGPSAELPPGRFPDGIDVLLSPNFHFLLSGKLNGKTIAPHTILRSHLSRHLHAFLTSHQSRLGLANISDFAMDPDTTLPSLLLTGNNITGKTKRPHLLLTSIDLCYQWTTNRPSSPFARSLALPFLGLLDNIVARFVTWHLVKRYPLAFGTWYTQLNTECALIPKILRSILAIVKRSPNQSWRTICRRYLKNIKRQQEATIEASIRAWLPPSDLRYAEPLSLSIEEAFCLSMEDVYRFNVRKPLFKVIHVRLGQEQEDTELCPGVTDHLETPPHEDTPFSGLSIPTHDSALPVQNPDLFAGLPRSFSFLKDLTSDAQDMPRFSASAHPPVLFDYASSDDDGAKALPKEDCTISLDTHANMIFDDKNDSDLPAALCDDALEQNSDGAMLPDDDEALFEDDNQVFYDSSDVLDDNESMLGSASDNHDRPLQFLELFDIDEADLMGFDSSDSRALDMFDEDEDGLLDWDNQNLTNQRNDIDVDGLPGLPYELEPAEHDVLVLEGNVTPELTPDRSQSPSVFDDASLSLPRTEEPMDFDEDVDVDVGLDGLLQRDKGHDYLIIWYEDDDILADDEDDLDDLVDDDMEQCEDEKDWMLDGEVLYGQQHIDVLDEL